MEELQRQVNELMAWKTSLERSSTIPLAVDQAFRARFGRVLYGSKTIDFASVASNSNATSTISVVGAEIGNPVVLGLPSTSVTQDDIIFEAWVSASDVVTVRAYNADSTNARDPGSGTFTVAVLKQ